MSERSEIQKKEVQYVDFDKIRSMIENPDLLERFTLDAIRLVLEEAGFIEGLNPPEYATVGGPYAHFIAQGGEVCSLSTCGNLANPQSFTLKSWAREDGSFRPEQYRGIELSTNSKFARNGPRFLEWWRRRKAEYEQALAAKAQSPSKGILHRFMSLFGARGKV